MTIRLTNLTQRWGIPTGIPTGDGLVHHSLQNNYALESFGGGTRCFSQADKWEQKSCTMLKQWTRWVAVVVTLRRYGSGCYRYQCAAGQLHIEVRDTSFSCGFQGQKIPIQLQVATPGVSWTPCLDGLLDPLWLGGVPRLLLRLP